MTFALEQLIQEAARELVRTACEFDGHDWESEGGRCCPMGAEGCSQTVYRCRSCGTYDYGTAEDSPAVRDCQTVCGDSMTGWQGGHLDPNRDELPHYVG